MGLVLSAWVGMTAYILKNLDTMPTNFHTFGDTPDGTKLLLTLYSVVSVVVFMVKILPFFYVGDPVSRTMEFVVTMMKQEKTRNRNVNDAIDGYNDLHHGDDADKRNTNYQKLVDAYYELATQFYEWGWGQSFHFASRMNDEGFTQSIKRHEYYLGGRLNVKAGGKVLDCGCGIGGPYRNISRFCQVDVTGITINQYQVDRGNAINRSMGLDRQCRSIQGDFMKLPFEENSFDAVYAIEATCHAPSRVKCFSEILRVLKPGATFACYEWCLTDKYDPDNADHRRMKKQIEEGDGLPDIATCAQVAKDISEAGFELVEARDMVLDEHVAVPWYTPLTPSYNVFSQRFQFTPIGMWLTKKLLRVLEAFYLAPAGTVKVQTMLQQGAIGLADGGVEKIFTPMFLLVARKPVE